MNLSEALSSSDAVLFVGSGVSNWSGLPSWGVMLDELADYLDHHGIGSDLVRAERRDGDLLQAASYGFDKLTRHQQGEFVRLACRYGVAHPSPLHRILVSLGPRCFITTNYDNLIEEALRLWRPNEFFRPPITNRNLIGMPEIVQARSSNFVFKPHGDAADSESIVLTREHYRMLLPGGERQSTLESLKLLLVSRPVIYVGFGLRDPDFLYLKDVLSNIYKGGTRDHFALMADVSAEQIDYWRRAYGIHLISYRTSKRSDGSRDHSELLGVLEKASQPVFKSDATIGPPNATDPQTLLALARYASGLSRTTQPISEFAVRVSRKRMRSSDNRNDLDSFSGAAVETLLDRFHRTIVLVGLPGAGKSYALRKNAARHAETLHAACLQDNPDAGSFVVPIFVDLKLYQGSLEHLIAASLPPSLDFRGLLERFTLRIYLDSFNEVPRKFVESGECETDLRKFIETVGSTATVIGSRTLDGLEGLGCDSYELESIEKAYVIEELGKRGISLGGRFQGEMTALLRRPFYFRYVLDGEVSLRDEFHPRDFYRLLLEGVGKSLAVKMHQSLDLINILRPVAYQALNSGVEAFPLEILLRSIQANGGRSPDNHASASDIANGLVSCSILVPYSGNRVAFVHQSITEYLASLELAESFATAPALLSEKLSLRRWDQALFLALSHLQPPLDREFFHGVLDIDLSLAVSSAKFVETNRQQFVGELLDELIKRRAVIDKYDYKLQFALARGFPVTDAHLPQLRQIVQSAHPLKGAAAQCVVGILGATVKTEYLRLLVDFRNDYNFCSNAIGPALAQYATDEDLALLARWARDLESKLPSAYNENEFNGFSSGAAAFAARLPLDSVRQNFLPSSPEDLKNSPIRTAILRNFLRDRKTTEGLMCAFDLLLVGDKRAAVTIHFILYFADTEDAIDTTKISTSHLETLLEIYQNQTTDDDVWAWNAINDICKHRPDLRSTVEMNANGLHYLARAGLMMCAQQNQEAGFAALGAALEASDEELLDADYAGINQWKMNWQGKESLFLRLLERRNVNLSDAILQSGHPPSLDGFGRVQISDAISWLGWLDECRDAGHEWLVLKLSGFLGKYANESLAEDFVAEFNDPKSAYRVLLISYVLPCFGSITTDDLSREAITFALDDLLHHEIHRWRRNFLGGAATESFAVERLVPLLTRVEVKVLARVRDTLEEAGQRHGRRYF